MNLIGECKEGCAYPSNLSIEYREVPDGDRIKLVPHAVCSFCPNAGKGKKVTLAASSINEMFNDEVKRISAIEDVSQRNEESLKVFGRSWENVAALVRKKV